MFHMILVADEVLSASVTGTDWLTVDDTDS